MFVRGVATGAGRIYHPSGQLLYEGQVFEGQPRADAFLGLSLAEVEAAFTEHWLLYTCDGVTAFVYPYFHLMFISDSPVQLISPSQQDEQTERERQELLEAISAAAAARQDDGEQPVEAGNAGGLPEPIRQRAALPSAAGPIGDRELAPDTNKSDVLITEVLSYGQPLAGTAQPGFDTASGTRAAGWREWFSDLAMDESLYGAAAVQTGPFVYEFTRFPVPDQSGRDYYLAYRYGVETTTVLRDWKDSPVWYQCAVRRDEGI